MSRDTCSITGRDCVYIEGISNCPECPITHLRDELEDCRKELDTWKEVANAEREYKTEARKERDQWKENNMIVRGAHKQALAERDARYSLDEVMDCISKGTVKEADGYVINPYKVEKELLKLRGGE